MPAEVVELQDRIDELIQERDALRAGSRVQGMDPAATAPASGAEELNL